MPVFVYGSLRSREAGESVIAAFVEERKPASARGSRLTVDSPHAAVRFFSGGDELPGELLWLTKVSGQDALDELDRYEGVPHLYERVRTTVSCDGEMFEAFAYQWARLDDLVAEYLFAVRRKIEIANYHFIMLQQETGGEVVMGDSPNVPVQAHFEAILFCAAAVSDQLAEAINLGLELGLVNPNLPR